MRLYLTFDDGPDPRWTPGVLDALEAADARATFFVLGPSAEREPALIARMVAEGHEVALHADRHVRHSELDEAAIAGDTERALARLRGLGVSPERWRTPWGVVTSATRLVAGRFGLRLCGWTADTHDWGGTAAEAMLARVAPRIADGQVVLMHDGLGPGCRRLDCVQTVELTAAHLATGRKRAHTGGVHRRSVRLTLALLVAMALLGAAPAMGKTRAFRSPSHNIVCLYSSTGGPGPFIRCDVLSLNDTGFFLERKHKATRRHVTDAVNLPGSKTLAYGKRRSFGRYTCRSLTSGMKCVNRRNHHGFKLNRAEQKLF